MTDPVYGLIFAGVLIALLTAMVVPAPADPVDEEGGLGAALLGIACAAVIAMGVLALSGHPAESTICGAIAWLLVMPCVWLSRAPRPAGGWMEEDEEDDDDGGSPRPQRPSDPPAPDDRLPGLRPSPSTPAARGTGWAVPVPAPAVLPTAAHVQVLLAAQETEQLHAAREVQQLIAAANALAAIDALAAAQPATASEPPAPSAPRHKPAIARLHPTPRPRGEHRAFASLLAAVRRARPALERQSAAPRREHDESRRTGAWQR